MTKNTFYLVILWTSALLVDLPVYSYSQWLKNANYIKNDDPVTHVEGTTYGCLTFLRGCLARKRYLNEEGYNNKKCSAYNYTRYYHQASDPLIHNLVKCRGNIYNCIAVKHFSVAVIMNIDNQIYGLSVNEKYKLIKVEEINNRSPRSLRAPAPIKIINNTINEMCKCYCDDQPERETVQSFCQDIVETDSLLGYVLTGIRFKIRKQMVYLEVQQGKLVNGTIDFNTIHWKNSQLCRYYGKLTYDHRSLQLDDVLIPEGYVITGVLWIRYHHRTTYFGHEMGRLMLGIKVTKIDNYGNLIPKEWLIQEKVSAPRRRLHVFYQNILSSPTNKSEELSIPNKHYIKFRTTGWLKDFAQHVVPFIDLQEVVSNSSKPITGVGVYYRSSYKYGGFVALKLIIENE